MGEKEFKKKKIRLGTPHTPPLPGSGRLPHPQIAGTCGVLCVCKKGVCVFVYFYYT